MLVRFPGLSKPLVSAAAESSSPILTMDIIKGIIRYSNNASGPHLPRRIWRIRIASEIALYSSLIVGKNLKITASGMVSLSEMCIRSIEAMNSLTVVVDKKNAPHIIPGANFVIIEQTASIRNDIVPVRYDIVNCSARKHTI